MCCCASAESATLDRALANCPALFHVAADYRLGTLDPSQLYRTNVEGTRNILTAARNAGVDRIVYTSSVATIGLPADGSPGSENTPVALTDMIGHYKRSKYLAEELVRDSAQTIRVLTSCTSMTSLQAICWRFTTGDPVNGIFLEGKT